MKHATKKKKIDISRLFFILSWCLGAIVVMYDVLMPAKVVGPIIVPNVSEATYSFLNFFIATFTVGYLGRKGTDAWHAVKTTSTETTPTYAASQYSDSDTPHMLTGPINVADVNQHPAPVADGASNVHNLHDLAVGR